MATSEAPAALPDAKGNSNRPRGKRRSRKLPWIMSRAECEALKTIPNLRCPTGLRNRTMIELMHRGGLRVGEVTALRRRDIIWDRNMVEVRAGKGKVDRTVELDKGTMECLRAWDSRRPRGERFFNTLKGKGLSRQYIAQMVKRLAARAVRRGRIDADRAALITPHKLRHAHATELAAKGVPLEELRVRLGHADIRATALYLHARPEGIGPFLDDWTPKLPPPPGA